MTDARTTTAPVPDAAPPGPPADNAPPAPPADAGSGMVPEPGATRADARVDSRTADGGPPTTHDAHPTADKTAGSAVDRPTGGPNQPAPQARMGAPLFDNAVADQLRSRWDAVQTGFVDEPRSAVEQADRLVGEVMKRLADGFASEHRSLEQQWSRGDDVSTEDLRVALRRYRSFFDRLLSL